MCQFKNVKIHTVHFNPIPYGVWLPPIPYEGGGNNAPRPKTRKNHVRRLAFSVVVK